MTVALSAIAPNLVSHWAASAGRRQAAWLLVQAHPKPRTQRWQAHVEVAMLSFTFRRHRNLLAVQGVDFVLESTRGHLCLSPNQFQPYKAPVSSPGPGGICGIMPGMAPGAPIPGPGHKRLLLTWWHVSKEMKRPLVWYPICSSLLTKSRGRGPTFLAGVEASSPCPPNILVTKSDSESPLAHYLCAWLPGGSGGMPDMCPGTGGGCEPTLKAPEVDTSAGVSTAGTWHAFFVHCWTKVSGLRPVLWPCRGFACWACQAPSVKDKDHQACGDAGNNVHGSVMNMGYGPIPCTALLLKLELCYVKIHPRNLT